MEEPEKKDRKRSLTKMDMHCSLGQVREKTREVESEMEREYNEMKCILNSKHTTLTAPKDPRFSLHAHNPGNGRCVREIKKKEDEK